MEETERVFEVHKVVTMEVAEKKERIIFKKKDNCEWVMQMPNAMEFELWHLEEAVKKLKELNKK